MDTSQANHVSLCAGYGGIDLGLRRAIPRLRTIAYSEIEGYACANLVAKIEAGLLDPAPIWTDVKSFPYRQFHGCVHILSGGYPCQPFSAAGKRLGRNDPRHLWPWIADGIALMRPSLCFFENVEGHITLGLRDVLNDLGELGYRTTWGVFSASEVGAPHQRKRVFILAHKLGAGLEGLLHNVTAQGRKDEGGHATGCSQHRGNAWPSRPGEEQYKWEPPRTLGHSTRREDDGREPGDMGQASGEGRCVDNATNGSGQGVGNCAGWNGKGQQLHIRQGQREHRGTSGGECEWRRQAQPPLGGNPDGSSGGLDNGHLFTSTCNRTDELRLLGNGVVPATAALAFTTLLKGLI